MATNIYLPQDGWISQDGLLTCICNLVVWVNGKPAAASDRPNLSNMHLIPILDLLFYVYTWIHHSKVGGIYKSPYIWHELRC